MKKCPFCAEDIQDAAIKCKHCGESLAVTLVPDAPAPVAPAPENPLTKEYGLKMDPDKEKKAAAVIGLLILPVILFVVYTMNSGGMLKSMGNAASRTVSSAVTGESSWEIKIGGNSKFSGSLMVIKDGKSEQRTIEGTAPTSYSERAAIVSVSIQKKDTSGHLEVEITREGQSVAKQATDAEYGVVSVSGR